MQIDREEVERTQDAWITLMPVKAIAFTGMSWPLLNKTPLRKHRVNGGMRNKMCMNWKLRWESLKWLNLCKKSDGPGLIDNQRQANR
jgi:hypothetical protein